MKKMNRDRKEIFKTTGTHVIINFNKFCGQNKRE